VDFHGGAASLPQVSEQLPTQSLITFITIGVILTIGVYFLSRWAIDRLYGQHIKKLKELVEQMEETV
jgi:hypothetical protein